MRAARTLACSLAVALAACSSQPAAQSGSGGSAGVVDAGHDSAGDTGGAGDAEPAGPRVLTLLHGVVDAPRVRFCFGPAGGAATGSPMPAAGLNYGGALVVRSLPGLDLGSDAIQIYVVAGDDSVIAGQSCQSLIEQAGTHPDAGPDASLDASSDAQTSGDAEAGTPPPPALRVAALPQLPAGTLGLKSSYLLVVMGCIGQSNAFSDPMSDTICGAGYRPDRPTLLPALVRMSRATKAGALGLQVINASRATARLTLDSEPPKGGAQSPVTLATDVQFGAIQPASADLSHTLADFGAPLANATLQVRLVSSAPPDFSEAWSAALSAAGLSSVENGSDYALVVVGPNPTLGGDKWWNAPLVTLVPTAP